MGIKCNMCSKKDETGECTDHKYKYTQYEEYNDGIFCYGEHVNARYIDQNQPDYKGNPFIEALPPYLNIEYLLSNLEQYPLYSETERKEEEDYKFDSVLRIKKKFFYIFPKHLEIYNKLFMAIRGGYEERNILTPDFIKRLNFTSSLLNDKWLKNKASKLTCISSNSDTAMDGWSLIGMSGEGKTVAINRLLTTFPQVIVHTEYGGRKFLFKQLVWVKIDCTSKGTVKQICIKFFEEVDSILGTEYLRKFGNKKDSEDNMIVAMAHITELHAIGTLIIDEIQHLATSKTGIEGVLNFLVTLKNEMRIPIIYIGTFKVANSVLGKDYTQARRASGIGEIVWNPMPKSKEWDDFISRMWKYQWTTKECKLTEEISKVFYEKTMGITDMAIKLYMGIQIDSIVYNKDITVKCIEEFADNKMPLTSEMIKALREGDMKKLALFDDIKSFDIEKYIEDTIRTNEYQKCLKQQREDAVFLANQKRHEIENEVIVLMMKNGTPEKLAERIAKSVVKEHGIDKGIVFYECECGKKIAEIKKNKNDSCNSGSKIHKSKKRQNIKDDCKSGYEEYKEKNIIKPMEDD